MATKTFRELIAWQKAQQFVIAVYQYSTGFPKTEMYALSSQFRRAAVSIAANIAEGYKKRSRLDKARFFNIAQGSIEECQYYLILSNDPGYGKNTELTILLDEISRILEAYIQKLLSRNF